MSKPDGGIRPPGVSPTRKVVSGVLLIGLLGILGIELRAGLGQMLSVKALQADAPDGFFRKEVSHADLKARLKFAPTETEVRSNESETTYRYEWFSLLQPLLGRPTPNVFVDVQNREGTAVVVSFHGGLSDEAQEAQAAQTNGPPTDLGAIMGGGGGGGMGAGGHGGGPSRTDMGGGGMGGNRPAPADPLLPMLDADKDGELSAEELQNAAAALKTGDKNGDGLLNGDEVRPAGGPGVPGGRGDRPPMEDDNDAGDAAESTPATPDSPASDAATRDTPTEETPAAGDAAAGSDQ